MKQLIITFNNDKDLTSFISLYHMKIPILDFDKGLINIVRDTDYDWNIEEYKQPQEVRSLH